MNTTSKKASDPNCDKIQQFSQKFLKKRAFLEDERDLVMHDLKKVPFTRTTDSN